MKNLVNYFDENFDEFNESISSKCKSKHDDNYFAMKAFKKKSRDEEIEAHGKPINHGHIFRDKTKYNRKNKHKNNRFE